MIELDVRDRGARAWRSRIRRWRASAAGRTVRSRSSSRRRHAPASPRTPLGGRRPTSDSLRQAGPRTPRAYRSGRVRLRAGSSPRAAVPRSAIAARSRPSRSLARPGCILKPNDPATPSGPVASHRVDGPATSTRPSRRIRSTQPSAGTTAPPALSSERHSASPERRTRSEYTCPVSQSARDGVDTDRADVDRRRPWSAAHHHPLRRWRRGRSAVFRGGSTALTDRLLREPDLPQDECHHAADRERGADDQCSRPGGGEPVVVADPAGIVLREVEERRVGRDAHDACPQERRGQD